MLSPLLDFLNPYCQAFPLFLKGKEASSGLGFSFFYNTAQCFCVLLFLLFFIHMCSQTDLKFGVKGPTQHLKDSIPSLQAFSSSKALRVSLCFIMIGGRLFYFVCSTQAPPYQFRGESHCKKAVSNISSRSVS